jgi:hypothetical protein
MPLTRTFRVLLIIVALFSLSICFMPAAAGAQQKTIDGIIVNLGIVPATQAGAFANEPDTHRERLPSGAQHLLISLMDAKTGTHISGAEVSVEIKDPRGKAVKKTLTEAVTAGVPDYSGLVTFPWAGKYEIKVSIKPKGSSRLLATTLTWIHDI